MKTAFSGGSWEGAAFVSQRIGDSSAGLAVVDKDLAVLKAFFSWCTARNLAASNPVRRVKFFNDDNSRLRYLTEDQYKRLVQAAKTVATSRYLTENNHHLRAHRTASRQPLPLAVGSRGLSESGRSHSPDQERPPTCGPLRRHCRRDVAGALYRAPARLSLRVRTPDGSEGRRASQGRQERVSHGA